MSKNRYVINHLESEKLPKSIWFIVVSKFLERFSSNGISTVLIIYLNVKLNFDEDTSTAIYHINELLTFFFPIFGAIIAETFCGLYKTIIIMFAVGLVGGGIVVFESINPEGELNVILSLIGLLMIFGTLGSCTSNLVTFGANQCENNAEQLKLYFSLQMICIKFGALIGRFFTPVLREDVKCLGSDSCYPLAFAVPTLSILTATILMICGRSFFKMIPPSGNLFVKVCGCIIFGIKGKITRFREKKGHWLEYSTEKFGKKLVNDTKIILGTFTIFLSTAIYWAVFMQQGSRWIFQATKMNGDLGWYTLKPDQMIAFNSVFVILLIPICNYIFYPFLNYIGIRSLLHKITIGGFLCCIAFLISAYVETKIEQNYISILWLLPQFAILALSENFVYISLINFAFSETPDGMKSVMTAFVFLIIALGNFLITLVSGLHLFNTQFYEFLFFAGILFVDMLIFMGLSVRYTYAKDRNPIDES